MNDSHYATHPKMPRRFYDANTRDFNDALRKSLGDTAKDNRSYFITGPVGTGKTHLACAILKEWTAARVGFRACRAMYPQYDEMGPSFISVPELLGTVKASFDGHGKSSEWIIRSHQNAQCLAMDDLGAEQKTEWSFSCLYRIISHREGEMLPTIVTSNLTLAQLEEWEPRIASRLAGMTVITLGGKDMRLKRNVPAAI